MSGVKLHVSESRSMLYKGYFERSFVGVCIYIYIYTQTHLFACAYIFICLEVYMYVHIYIHGSFPS